MNERDFTYKRFIETYAPIYIYRQGATTEVGRNKFPTQVAHTNAHPQFVAGMTCPALSVVTLQQFTIVHVLHVNIEHRALRGAILPANYDIRTLQRLLRYPQRFRSPSGRRILQSGSTT
jgi:hypothetical protein